ncbi:type IV secretion system DNA-binding domain-containing protein [Patescibacteria group bacterium]|nr:type IV secretion system DNA-binding domain-containing protein [Patescibacteria group bacterium]MBU1563717.1 type IV secretion system DNA-binding domain-containing protein [Patescibacteria group bacterium]
MNVFMNDITVFAKTNFRNKETVFGIKRRDRRQHMYVIGKSGTGKTELLKNIALQDIQNGEGVCIVDPHGEFVEEVVDKIPSNRVNDVVYFNPADTEYPIGFNVLQVTDEKYKHLVSSDLMGIFTKIWANVWSARMEYILNNCILALVDTPETTLLGIIRILVDKDYRQKVVNNVKDPVVRSFWINEYASWRDQFRNEAIAPIQNKVGQFLSTSLIRNIVGQAKSTINVAEIMNSNKILLVNVSKGRIGEDNSALLGAMLITKIQLAAMERVRIPETERKDFYLYVDEFQNFATDSFANVLSEARKYRLNLIVAHQYVGQLVTDTTTRVRDSIFGNVGTLISLRVGAADAEFLEKEFFPEFVIQDLVNLDNYNIYLKMMIDGVSCRPFSATTLPPMDTGVTNQREKMIKVSRERYANPQKEVEEKISRWSGVMSDGDDEGYIRKDNVSSRNTTDQDKSSIKKNKTTCWSCGKGTEVSFEPDGRRPIYCKECLEKVKAGEDVGLGYRPVAPIIQSKTDTVNQQSALSELGIEFKGTKQPRRVETPQTVGLDEAFNKEPVSFRRKKRAEVDLKGLRATLEEAMGKKE